MALSLISNNLIYYCKNMLTSPPIKRLKKMNIVKKLCLCTVPAYKIKFDSENQSLPKSLEAPDPQTMTHGYLIKNAAICAVDSATTLLTQTACRLIELEEKYTELLGTLISHMESHIKALGNEFHEAQVWDSILHTRFMINEVKESRQEMQALFFSAERMLESAAEAAHISGAEYAAAAASERLFSAKTQIKHLQTKTDHLTAKLNTLEVKNIQASSQQAEKRSKTQDEETPSEETEIKKPDSQDVQDMNETGVHNEQELLDLNDLDLSLIDEEFLEGQS